MAASRDQPHHHRIRLIGTYLGEGSAAAASVRRWTSCGSAEEMAGGETVGGSSAEGREAGDSAGTAGGTAAAAAVPSAVGSGAVAAATAAAVAAAAVVSALHVGVAG